MRRASYTGPVSPYAGRATEKLAAADAKVREANARARDAEGRATAADERAQQLEAALERIGERLDAIEKRMDRKVPAVKMAEGQVDATGGAVLYGLVSIAAFMGTTYNQAKHRAAQNDIPTYHMGKTICANRAALAAWLDARAAESNRS